MNHSSDALRRAFAFLLGSCGLNCSFAKQENSLFEDSVGRLIQHHGGADQVVWKEFEQSDVMMQTDVFDRGSSQYLVREGFTIDRQVIVIPIINDGQGLRFDHILLFYRNLAESGKAQSDVREGFAFQLASTVDLRSSDWESILRLTNEANGKRDTRPHVLPAAEEAPGYSRTTVRNYSGDGTYTGATYYIDEGKESWSLVSTACFFNCREPDSSLSGKYVGGIKKSPIILDLKNNDGDITGTYRYRHSPKNQKLYLKGTLDRNLTLKMTESTDPEGLDVTGSFSASRQGGVWRGIWTSATSKDVLPFFAVASNL